MTMRNRMKTEYIAIAFGLLGCTGHQPTYEYIFEAEPVDLQVKQIEGGYEVEGTSALQVPGHFTWGGSVSKAEDGKYYMIYSAPETGVHPFNNAWVFGSKLGLAVSERPDGGSASWASSTTRTGLPLTLPRGMPKALQIRMCASLATNTTCTMRQQ